MAVAVMEQKVGTDSLAPAVKTRMEAFVAQVAAATMNHPVQRANAELYVRGLLAAGARKSLEPLVERLDGDGDYQSLQQFLADSPWDAQRLMRAVAEVVAPVVGAQAWVLDDTGFPKDGKKSPGVKRQYSGTLGKIGNCQIGVSLHAVGEQATLPLGWALYLPEDWCADGERRQRAKIPEDVVFQTKPQLGLGLVEQAAGWAIDRAPVLGDAAYGENTQLRTALDSSGIEYVLSINPDTTIYAPGAVFAVPDRKPGKPGRSPAAHHADREPVSVGRYAQTLTDDDFQTVTFRGAGKSTVSSRFAFKRVTAAHPVTRDRVAPRTEWLIIEWPEGHETPSDYWISNLPAATKPQRLARLARLRWMIELDYRQLKGELGLDHYEGRSYLGWYHHTGLVTAAHAFLTLERTNPKAPRRASRSPKRSAYSRPSSTAGPAIATPANSQ
ncbi:MAG TPA: IS701 family transposase [Solirubrobacteraceae bacterium]|nr:IS701 family transposase [Solirubrobacteraceae bacterium]